MLHSNNDMLLDCVAFPQREMKVLTIVKSSIMPLARRGGGWMDGGVEWKFMYDVLCHHRVGMVHTTIMSFWMSSRITDRPTAVNSVCCLLGSC